MQKSKIIIILSLLVILLIGLSVASATEKVTQDNTKSNEITKDDNVIKKESTIAPKTNVKTNAKNNNIYVSKTGNDKTGTGTSKNPYKTIEKAITESTTNKIIIGQGTYKITNKNPIKINKNIGITNKNNEKVVITASKSTQDLFKIASNKKVTISNINFKNIQRRAIITNNGKLTLEKDIFTNNKVNPLAHDEKALINNYGTITIKSVNFTKNVGDEGTALYNTKKAEIINSNFKNNKAEEGSAIHNEKGTLTIKKSLFTKNTATSDGTISADYGKVTITDSQITSNKAESAAAIDNDHATFLIKNTKINNNYATDSSGAISNSGTMNIYNSQLNNNQVKTSNEAYEHDYNDGGAISLEHGTLNIYNSYLQNNIADCGGAVVVENGKLSIDGSKITGNKARYYGGAVSMEYDDDPLVATIKLTNNVIKNSAKTGNNIWKGLNSARVNVILKNNVVS